MNERLLENLADWMEAHGTIISDRQQSNAYVGIRIVKVCWHGGTYRIIQVDGMTFRIEKC